MGLKCGKVVCEEPVVGWIICGVKGGKKCMCVERYGVAWQKWVPEFVRRAKSPLVGVSRG